MTRGRFFSVCMLALLGSFAGGFVANRSIPVVFAQNLTLPQDNVRATSFTLVDSKGAVQATLRGGSAGAELVLNGIAGRGGSSPRVEISGNGGIVVRTAGGAVMWRSPQSPFLPLRAAN